MRIAIALLSGLVFGIGLVISGMSNPAKVLNFLDVFGHWDPSLAFVMAGAIAIGMPAFHFVPKMQKPVLANGFSLPTKQDFDRELTGGAALFGIGWGMVGLCPGPAIVALSAARPEVFLFFVFMIAGMVVIKSARNSPERFAIT